MTTALHTLIDEVKSYSNQKAIDNAVAFLERHGDQFDMFNPGPFLHDDGSVSLLFRGYIDAEICCSCDGSIYVVWKDSDDVKIEDVDLNEMVPFVKRMGDILYGREMVNFD